MNDLMSDFFFEAIVPQDNEFDVLTEMLDLMSIEYETNSDNFIKRLSLRNKSAEQYLSVICGLGTYGAEEGLLEIMGLLTEEEQENDDVVGYLTAAEVLERILAYRRGEYNMIIAPGETIKEALSDKGLRPYDLAVSLNITILDLEALLDGNKAIDTEIAKGLQELLGIEKQFWLNLQQIYEEEKII